MNNDQRSEAAAETFSRAPEDPSRREEVSPAPQAPCRRASVTHTMEISTSTCSSFVSVGGGPSNRPEGEGCVRVGNRYGFDRVIGVGVYTPGCVWGLPPDFSGDASFYGKVVKCT